MDKIEKKEMQDVNDEKKRRNAKREAEKKILREKTLQKICQSPFREW